MTVELPGKHYVKYSLIIPCLKSFQVAMEALCIDYEESDFKKQITSVLKWSVNFLSSNIGFLKTLS
jgi:hypothetical protein